MNKTNGRIDIKSPNTCNLFKLYDKIPANQCSTFRNAVAGQWESNALSNVFFSEQNMNIIQNGIRAGVYEKSNKQYLIGNQDGDNLKIIMRSIFLQHSSNLPNNISQQISELNQMVFNYCIPQVYSEAQAYMKYIDDASNMYMPLSHPVMTNNSNKQLEQKPWF